MKTVAIFDLDLTITNCDTFVSFLLHVLSTSPWRCLRALWLPVALVMYYSKLRDNTWLKQMFLWTIMGGATRCEVENWTQQYLAKLRLSGLRPKAVQAIEKHRAQGHHIVLASASFDFYVLPLSQTLGCDTLIATKAAWQNDKLCGTIDGDNCYGPHKLEQVRAFIGQGSMPCHTIAYSDHHSDLALLLWANEAYAVNPRPKMKELALQHAIPVLDWDS